MRLKVWILFMQFCLIHGSRVYNFESVTRFVHNGDEGSRSTKAEFEVDLEDTEESASTGLIRLKSCVSMGADRVESICPHSFPDVYATWNHVGLIDQVSADTNLTNPTTQAFLNLFQPLQQIFKNKKGEKQRVNLDLNLNGLHAVYSRISDRVVTREAVDGYMKLPQGGHILAAAPVVKVSETSNITYLSATVIESVDSVQLVTIESPLLDYWPVQIMTFVRIQLVEENDKVMKTEVNKQNTVPFGCDMKLYSETITEDTDSISNAKSRSKQPILVERSQLILSKLEFIRSKTAKSQVVAFLKQLPSQDPSVRISMLALCATMVCHEVALDLYSKNADVFTQYISTLSNAPLNKQITEDLMALDSKQVALRETILLAAANRIRRHCLVENKCDLVDQWIAETEGYLRDCSKYSKTEDGVAMCQASVFDALSNLRSHKSIAFITRFVCTTNGNYPRIQYAVLQALQSSLEASELTDELSALLLRVFFNRCPEPYEQTSRSLAGEILLEASPHLKDGVKIVKSLFAYFNNASSPSEKETAKLLWNSLHSKTEKWYQNQLVSLKENMGTTYNYNTLSIGQSSEFSSKFIEQDHFSVNYKLDMERLKGLLKRSTLSVDSTQAQENQNSFATIMKHKYFPLTTFEIFSSGLDSMLDSADESGNGAADEPMAAIRLGLFGSKERLIHLFKGSAELMAAVWAADGTPITAYQGNLLLNDVGFEIPLSNGLRLRLKVQSVLSVKVEGSVEISIWNRNSKSVVSTSIGLSMAKSCYLTDGKKHTSSMDTMTQISGKLDFVTHVNFVEDPPKLCMIIDQNDGFVWTKIPRGEERSKLNGKSFATHPKISAMCSRFPDLVDNDFL